MFNGDIEDSKFLKIKWKSSEKLMISFINTDF